MGRNGQLGLAVSNAESTKQLGDIRALDTDTRERGQPLTIDVWTGVRERWRRAMRDTSGICGGRLSCRRQRGDARTEAFGSARGREPELWERTGTTNKAVKSQWLTRLTM
jgi:hypothetical protein